METLRSGSDSSQVNVAAISSTGSADSHSSKSKLACHSRSLSRNQSIASTSAGRRNRAPPGKSPMRNPREHVEALGGARHGLGHQLAGDAGQHHAVAGEALQEIDVRREASEMRRAVQRDVDVAAPGVFDARDRELREHARDARAQHARGIERIDARSSSRGRRTAGGDRPSGGNSRAPS